MNKFEQLIEFVINDDEKNAKALFHEIVVEKSKDIYEEIMSKESEAEKDDHAEKAGKKVTKDIEYDDKMDESIEESDLGGSQVDDLIDEIEAEEEGVRMEDEDEEIEMIDVDVDDDDDDDEDLEDRVVDIEDKLDELMAEFEELMAQVDDNTDDIEGEQDEIDDIDSDTDMEQDEIDDMEDEMDEPIDVDVVESASGQSKHEFIRQLFKSHFGQPEYNEPTGGRSGMRRLKKITGTTRPGYSNDGPGQDTSDFEREIGKAGLSGDVRVKSDGYAVTVLYPDDFRMQSLKVEGLEEGVELVAAPKPVTTSPASKSPVAANSGQKGMDAKPVNIDAGNKGAQGRATPKYGDMNATTKPDVKPATKPELAQASGVNTKSVID